MPLSSPYPGGSGAVFLPPVPFGSYYGFATWQAPQVSGVDYTLDVSAYVPALAELALINLEIGPLKLVSPFYLSIIFRTAPGIYTDQQICSTGWGASLGGGVMSGGSRVLVAPLSGGQFTYQLQNTDNTYAPRFIYFNLLGYQLPQ